MSYPNINEMIGLTFTRVRTNEHRDELYFECADGTQFRFYHDQGCCESVSIEEIIGDLSDVENSPLLMAEEVVSSQEEPENYESCTWTFYKFATVKGYVTVRWLGTSNGYYGEGVTLQKTP